MTIYLDYQATTPLAPEAADAMRPWLDDKFANPHSSHRLGREAAAAVEAAREEIVATLLRWEPRYERRGDEADNPPWVTETYPWDSRPESGRLFFTSGATEALNWAIKGTFSKAPPDRRRIVTVATEHAAVLDTIRSLERFGAEVVVLPVDRKGQIDVVQAMEAVNERTALIACMSVNNEIGVVQHIGLLRMSEVARAHGVPVICDNVQGFGRYSVNVSMCDMVAISAHKIHGPKGIGALWVRKGFEPEPLLHGGGQEGGLRSGTLSPALCAGFGAAAKLAGADPLQGAGHVMQLYHRAREILRDAGWHMNGHRSVRWPGNLNIRRAGVDAARLLAGVRKAGGSPSPPAPPAPAAPGAPATSCAPSASATPRRGPASAWASAATRRKRN